MLDWSREHAHLRPHARATIHADTAYVGAASKAVDVLANLDDELACGRHDQRNGPIPLHRHVLLKLASLQEDDRGCVQTHAAHWHAATSADEQCAAGVQG